MSDTSNQPMPLPATGQPPQQENMLVSLLFNLVLPVLIWKKGPKLLGLEPTPVLLIALAFPVAYFVWDLYRRRKANWISVLGFVSLLMTGGIGLLKLPTHWYAIKEAGVPFLIGLVVLGSMFTSKPLVRAFLMNRSVMDVDRVDAELDARGTRSSFDKLLKNSTLWLFVSFMLSAVLNYVLAKLMVKSPAGTEAFNSEVGSMTVWSYVVIMVPSMAIMMFILYRLMAGLKRDTGLELEDVMWAARKQKETEAAKQARAEQDGQDEP